MPFNPLQLVFFLMLHLSDFIHCEHFSCLLSPFDSTLVVFGGVLASWCDMVILYNSCLRTGASHFLWVNLGPFHGRDIRSHHVHSLAQTLHDPGQCVTWRAKPNPTSVDRASGKGLSISSTSSRRPSLLSQTTPATFLLPFLFYLFF